MKLAKFIAYFMLGIALGTAGVGAFTQPWYFLAIMVCVIAIDVLSALGVSNEPK